MRPKGTATTKEDLRGMKSSQVLQAPLRRGCKRLKYVEAEEEQRENDTEGENGREGNAPKEEGGGTESSNAKRQRQEGL